MKMIRYHYMLISVLVLASWSMRSMEMPPPPPPQEAAAPSYFTQWVWEPAARGLSTAWEYTTWAASGSWSALESAWSGCAAAGELLSEMKKPDMHSHTPAHVVSNPFEKEMTVSNPFEHEKTYLARRRQRSQEALQKFLGQQVDSAHLPTIGFSFSGGGARAMLETVGWLSGAEKINIVDTASYMSGLSGSTWALFPWIASRLSLQDYKKQLQPRLTQSLTEHATMMRDEDKREILMMLGRRYFDGQSLGPVDLFGSFLSRLLLYNTENIKTPYLHTLSADANYIKEARYPLPLATAVDGAPLLKDSQQYRPTIEFSPFTVGSFELKSFIPVWALGRTFDKGSSQQVPLERGKKETPVPFYGHELPLGYFMGIWGSAFAADSYTVILELLKSITPITPEESCPVKEASIHAQVKLLESIMWQALTATGNMIKQKPADAPQISAEVTAKNPEYVKAENYGAARLPNFTRNIVESPFAHHTEFTLVDGGYQLIGLLRQNLGIIPLLYRNMDVITICDSSAVLQGSPSLRAAERLAKLLNLPFPAVDYANLDKQQASLIIDEKNLDAPIIVYMPGIANGGYGAYNPATSASTETLNFQYPLEESTKLMDLIEFNVTQSESIFKQAFIAAIERKKKKSTWGYYFGALTKWYQSKH